MCGDGSSMAIYQYNNVGLYYRSTVVFIGGRYPFLFNCLFPSKPGAMVQFSDNIIWSDSICLATSHQRQCKQLPDGPYISVTFWSLVIVTWPLNEPQSHSQCADLDHRLDQMGPQGPAHSEKMSNRCGVPTYTEILAFSTQTRGGEFLSYSEVVGFLIDCINMCTNNMHVTNKVEFTVQIHGVLATIKILIMKSFIRWKIHIGTSLQKIQLMPFMLASPH